VVGAKLAEADFIETTTLEDAWIFQKPERRVYLPGGTYHEMAEWALDAGAARRFAQARNALKEDLAPLVALRPVTVVEAGSKAGYSGAMGAWKVAMDKLYGWDFFEKLHANKPLVTRSLVDPPVTLEEARKIVADNLPALAAAGTNYGLAWHDNRADAGYGDSDGDPGPAGYDHDHIARREHPGHRALARRRVDGHVVVRQVESPAGDRAEIHCKAKER